MITKIKKRKKLTRPELSIIIPVKDQLPYLSKCLASLSKITDVNYELIIVNDGSNAETVRYLEQIPQLNVIHNQQNKGFVESCHMGADKSVGQYLLFLNSDTEIIEPLSFRKMLDVFKFNKDIGVVGAKLLLDNDTIQHAGLSFDPKQMNYTHRYYGKDKNDPVVCVNESIDVVTGACYMTSRDLWYKLGGFDRVYSPGYFEDTDYCLRAKELGFKTVYCGEAVLRHYQGKSFSGGPSKEHFGRNWEVFKQRWVHNSKVYPYPKIAACMIAFNEEDYIEASIRSIYDFVEKIIIIEGSTESIREFANKEGLSSDRTLEILSKIDDPKQKITIVSNKWKDKTEQRNTYCRMLDGMDFAWIIDSDEVWDAENVRKVEHLVFSRPEVPAFCFPFIDFWKDFGHRSRGPWEQFVGRKSLINLKLTGKIKYDSHILPKCENGQDIQAMLCKDIFFYHYSYVRTDAKIKQKIDYYINRGTPGFEIRKDWYEQVWLAWDKDPIKVEKELGTHPFGEGFTEIFTGNHPEVMRNHPKYMEYIEKYKLKLYISAKPAKKESFKNISMKTHNIFDLSTIIGDKKPFLILVDDMLEHVSYNALGSLLVHWYDKMELGGEIIIKTPNLQEVMKRYLEGNMNYATLVKFLYGEQINPEDYHSCLFDEKAIAALLQDVGFGRILVEKMDNNMYLYVVARKEVEFKKG